MMQRACRYAACCRPALMAAALVVCIGFDAQAQVDPSALSRGDRVEAMKDGEWKPGVVARIVAGNSIWVRFDGGSPIGEPVPADQVRLVAIHKPAGDADAAAELPKGMRTWTDSSGKFRIDAEAVSLAGGVLKLRRADGEEVELPVAKLSREDRALLGGAERPSDDEALPRSPSDPAAPAPATIESRVASGDRLHVVGFGPEDAPTIDVGGATAWAVVPDPGPAAENLSPGAISLGAAGFAAELKGFWLAPGRRRAYVVRSRGHQEHGGFDGSDRLEFLVCDLNARRLIASGMIPEGLAPLGVSYDGRRMLLAQQGNSPSDPAAGVLIVADITDDLATPMSAIRPHMWNSSSLAWDVDQAAFVGPDHIVSRGKVTEAILTRLSDSRPIALFPRNTGALPEPSPSGRNLAAAVDDAIVLVETATGKACGRLTAPGGADGMKALAFRRDGRRLAATDGQRVVVWNLENGEFLKQIALNANVERALAWADDRFILAGNSRLVNVDDEYVLWTYDDDTYRGSWTFDSGLVWRAAGGSTGTEDWRVMSAETPTPDALATEEKLRGKLSIAIPPAMRVRVDVQLSGSPDEIEKVRQNLIAALTASGHKHDESASAVLSVTEAPARQETISVMDIHSRQSTEHAVTVEFFKVALVSAGETLWSAERGNRPGFVSVNEGETTDQALARLMAVNRGALFSNVWIPSKLVRPGAFNGAFGHSKLFPD